MALETLTSLITFHGRAVKLRACGVWLLFLLVGNHPFNNKKRLHVHRMDPTQACNHYHTRWFLMILMLQNTIFYKGHIEVSRRYRYWSRVQMGWLFPKPPPLPATPLFAAFPPTKVCPYFSDQPKLNSPSLIWTHLPTNLSNYQGTHCMHHRMPT